YLLILKYAISSPGNSSWNSLLSVVSIIFFLTNIFFYHYYSPTFSLDPLFVSFASAIFKSSWAATLLMKRIVIKQVIKVKGLFMG
ncbi:MAG: hypothetical protein ACHQIM_02440, partial [Sphingobacteriales bacterium]